MRDWTRRIQQLRKTLSRLSLYLTVLVIVSASVFVLIAAVYQATSTILAASFNELEREDTETNVVRARQALDAELNSIDSKDGDWANWDDSYAFVQDGNARFIENNFGDLTFRQLKIDMIAYVQPTGKIVYAKAFNLDADTVEDVPASLQPYLAANTSLLRQAETTGSVTGVLALPERTGLVALRPILTNDGSGPSQGTLLFERYLDATEIKTLGETAHLALSVRPLNATNATVDSKAALAALSGPTSVFVQPLDSKQVAGYTLLPDLEQNPVLMLQVILPRRIHAQGQLSMQYMFLSLAAIGLVLDVLASGFSVGMIRNSLRRRRAEADLQRANDHLELRVQERTAELAQRERQVEAQLSRLQALHAIDEAITSSSDLRSILTLLLVQVTQQLQVDAAAILMLDPTDLTLNCVARNGFRSDGREDVHVRLGENFAGRAALERRVVSFCRPDDSPAQMELTPYHASEQFDFYLAMPLIAKGQVQGVLEIGHGAPLHPNEDWLKYLDTLATQAAVAIENSSLLGELHKTNTELALAYDRTLEGWSRALDMRDRETEGHTQRVAELSVSLAKAMGVAEGTLVQIRRGALLHDIGKMSIPDSILLKPGPLSDDEWVVMRKHPESAYELLLPITYLKLARDIPYCHHEKWDGSGYPRGLKGAQIPFAARLFAVVDVWDALRSDRPYRAAWTKEQAIGYIQQESGKHFDPEVIPHFLDLVKVRG